MAYRDAADVPRARPHRRAAGTPAAAAGALRARVGGAADLPLLFTADLGRQGHDRPRHAARVPGVVVDARGGGGARAAGDLRPDVHEPPALPGARPVNILDRYIVRTILGSVLMVGA